MKYLFFALLVLTGCTKHQGNCISFVKAPVTRVDGPNTGFVNQDIDLTVSFVCNNGCGQFGNFEITSSGTTISIAVIAKYEGCICTQVILTRQVQYRFRQSVPGTYTLKFYLPDNSYLTHTITIN